MKKSILSVAFALLGMSAVMRVSAQMTVPASNPDFFVTNFNDYGYPNSYTLDYSPFCPGSAPCSATNKQLTALVADDGITVKLYVNDQTPPVGAVWNSIVLPVSGGCAPDVILGNDFFNPGCYIAGVVVTVGGNVKLLLYRIANVGAGGGAISITAISSVGVSGTGAATGPAHIDVACTYSTPFPATPPGLPTADQFTITWRDLTLGIMGYSSSLNAPAASTTVVVNGNLNLSSPDVAYVERAGGTMVAEFAYVDMTIAPNPLYYSEWQTVPFALPGGPVLYDNTRKYFNPQPGVASVIRIDGIDDYTKNMVGGPNATFCIVASAPPPGVSVLEYNDKTGPFVANNITAPVTLPGPGITNARNQIPVVTSGPGRFYSVGYWSDPPSSSGGAQQMYYATAINWATGKPTTDPNAYGIMQQSYDPMYLPGLCLSATGNTNAIGRQDLFAGFDNYAFLLYKYSLPIAPYSFKPAPAAAVTEATGDWQVFPNPAASQATLMAPGGFNAAKGAAYEITDMGGKTLLGSEISDANQQINVNNLPAGSYLLNIHEGAKETKTIKFVKE